MNVAMLFIRRIPEDLKNRYKSICAKKGVTLTDAIIQHMKEVVEKEEAPRKQKT